MASSRPTTVWSWKWITRPSRVLLALCLAAGPLAGAEAPDGAMTNEDVVRLVERGLPVEEIVRAIRAARTTAFELDPEMLVELRRAMVPDAVIEAMQEVQRAGRPPAPVAAEAPAMGTLDLVFEKDASSVPRGTAVSSSRDWNDRTVSLSFFVICLDPLHAPDLWDILTPLGAAFPRHHVIWFLDANRPYRQDRRGGTIYLDLPERAGAALSAGSHDLRVGVAWRAGNEPWRPLATATATVAVPAGGTSSLHVRVRTSGVDRLSRAAGATPRVACEVVSVEPPPPVAPDPNAPPPPP